MTLCMLRDISRAMSVYDLRRRATSISRWFTAMRQRRLSDRVSAGLNFRFRSTRSSRAFVIIATNNASSVDAVSGQQGGLVTTEHELKEASTHKSVNTHAGTWPLTFCPKINDFFRTHHGTFCTTRSMILAASVFEMLCGKTDRHTDKRRLKPYPPWVNVSLARNLSGTKTSANTEEHHKNLRR